MRHDTIYELRCDYIDREGHYVELTHPTLLPAHTLDRTEWRMIDANQPPGHLPLQIEEHNLSLKLLYRFTGMRKLSEHLQLNSLSFEQFYRLMLSIVNMLEEAKAYMLTEERFVLLPEFIFVEPQQGEQIRVIYLPITGVEKPSLQQELTDLIVFIVSYIRDLQGVGVQALLQQLRADQFSLSSFKLELIRHMEGAANDNEQFEQVQIETEIPEQTPLETPTEEPKEPEERIEAPAEKMTADPILSETDELEMYGGSELSVENIPKEDKDPFKFTYLITSVVALMLLALAWRIYFAFATETMLYICVAGSFMIIATAIAFVVWQRKNIQQREQAWKPYDPATYFADQAQTAAATAETEDDYYAKLGDRTTLLAPSSTLVANEQAGSDLTEVLLPTDLEAQIASSQVWQLIHLEPERSILLSEGSHRIGRDADHASIVLSFKGISRVHCELTVTEDTVTLIDLGSSNGTKINDQPLVPYKPYTLTDGEEIQIGHERYTYSTG